MAVTLGALAVRHGCVLHGDPDLVVDRIGTLRDADSRAVAFLANPAYRAQLAGTAAGAVILTDRDVSACPSAALVTRDPYVVFARIARELHPGPPLRPGVHPAALVGPDSLVPESCEVGAGAIIGTGVSLGERVFIGSGAVVGDGTRIGDDCRIMAGAIIYAAVVLGPRCLVHAGAVLGADGFGFARDRDGSYVKVPQLGTVRVGADVEIGANTTIDRGAIGDTVLADGVKLDNQIQVGHNVTIGAHTVIAAQTGISGSTTIGARCVIGGQVGVAGHICVADDVVIGGGANVTGSIRRAGIYGGGGTPADEIGRWRRNMVRFGQLDDLARRLRALERQLAGAQLRGESE